MLLCGWSLLLSHEALGQSKEMTVNNWVMQDASHVTDAPARVSSVGFSTMSWYKAVVPGTVLTTLVNAEVYPEPLYGENMRAIPESLNKVSYWYRTEVRVPLKRHDEHVWLHFGGVNYSAELWVNGSHIGDIRGAFRRGDFDISENVRPGKTAAIAVLVHPQPHPGTPHEHTQALGVGHNGGETALDGATFLSTIGWDWLPAVRDRDTGIWLPVTMDVKGPLLLKDTFITSELSNDLGYAALRIEFDLENMGKSNKAVKLLGTIQRGGHNINFAVPLEANKNGTKHITLTPDEVPELGIKSPDLWWPNGYGQPNLYHVELQIEQNGKISDYYATNIGIRKVEYALAGSPYLTISVNGVKVMVRGGDWGLDEAMKRIPRERLDAEFRMHKQANLNMIRNWVGQSTSPDFYDLADRYGLMIWDEFFQPNPGDGPNVTDTATYLANVRDKVLRYRNHPSIVVWCARNEGYPPKVLDEQLKQMMAKLDPQRTYQSNSAEGRGVSSHGPYYWRSPRYYYALNEAFKTETGSVSVPTIESIQGMMPRKDWENINDDWAQHDMAAGAQRGDEYPRTLAKRYGHIRNLADFVRKAQLANYEAFRAMYEGRNAKMFTETTGVITWMSNPAHPSFVWQLYHYDLEPNSALFAVQKACEKVHIQLNESDWAIQVVNNLPTALSDLVAKVTIYRFDGSIDAVREYRIPQVDKSSVIKAAQLNVNSRITPIFFVKLELLDGQHHTLSSNFYWQNVAQDDFAALNSLPTVPIDTDSSDAVNGDRTVISVTIRNAGKVPALLVHLQLHREADHERVLPVFYSDNYVTLTPGESREITVECATADLHGSQPEIQLDGYNVAVGQSDGEPRVVLNENAQPSHWPATHIVPD